MDQQITDLAAIERAMSESRIEVGDLVAIDFNQSKFTLTRGARVLYMPAATGDSWIFRDEHTPSKRIIYVNEGCTITLMEKCRSNEKA